MQKKVLFYLIFILSLNINAEWIGLNTNTMENSSWKCIYKDDNNMRYELSISGFQQKEEVKDQIYQLLTIPGYGYIKNEGKPKLPKINEYIAICDFDSININITPTDSIEYNDYNIYPQGRYVNCGGLYKEIYFKDIDFYNSNSYYPEKKYDITGFPKFRNQQLVEVEIYPIRSNPYQKKIIVYTNFLIEFEIINRKNSYNVNTGIFSKICEDNFLGYSGTGMTASINTNSSEGEIFWNWDYEIHGDIDYLMIVAKELYPVDPYGSYIMKLANHRKNYNGFKIGIVKWDKDMYHNNYQELYSYIKNECYDKIQNAPHTYDGKLGYIVLIGDHRGNPINGGIPAAYPDYYIPNEEQASDYYYSCMTNGLYSGQPDDLGDFFIGRIPAGSIYELSSYVNKVVNYEPLKHEHLSGWRNKIWIAHGATSSDIIYDNVNDSINNILENRDELGMSNYDITVSTIGNSTLDNVNNVNLIEIQNNVNDNYNTLFNQDYWIMSYNDHGSYSGWGAGELNGEPIHFFYNNEIQNGNFLDGKNTLPLIFSLACNTGGFDDSYDCLAERFTVSNQHGAIGFIGSTGISYTSTTQTLQYLLFKSIVKERFSQMGELLLHAKLNKKLVTKEKRQFILFGDPALNIYYDDVVNQKPDFTLYVEDGLEFKYKSLGEDLPIEIKFNLVNLGNNNNGYEKTITVALDQPTNIIESSLQLILDVNEVSCEGVLIFDMDNIRKGWHKLYLKVDENSDEISHFNNTIEVEFFIGQYKTENFPYKIFHSLNEDEKQIFLCDFNNDNQIEFIGDYVINEEGISVTGDYNFIINDIVFEDIGNVLNNNLSIISKDIESGRIYIDTYNDFKEIDIYSLFPQYNDFSISDIRIAQLTLTETSADQLIVLLTKENSVFEEEIVLIKINNDFTGDILSEQSIEHINTSLKISKINAILDINNDGTKEIILDSSGGGQGSHFRILNLTNNNLSYYPYTYLENALWVDINGDKILDLISNSDLCGGTKFYITNIINDDFEFEKIYSYLYYSNNCRDSFSYCGKNDLYAT
ncbi:MAG TPA: C25 family cysteine peptidase [Bacilli bacterium]|nr:C25 family cysteine peptidase [Bacilli bacterium]